MNLATRFGRHWLVAAALFAAGISPAAACQLCRAGGDPQACLDLLKTDRSGELRLDAAIDKFQTAPAQSAPLTIITSAADLPAIRPRRAPAPVTQAVRAPVARGRQMAVDGGLIGLAVVGGFFCLRARRPDDEVSTERLPGVR